MGTAGCELEETGLLFAVFLRMMLQSRNFQEKKINWFSLVFINDYLNKVLVLDCRVAVLPSQSSATCPVMSPPFLSFPLVSILILFSHLTSGSTKRSLSFKVTLHNLRAFQFF